MKLTFNNLCKFDKRYFTVDDYDIGIKWTRDDLLSRLATYVFDTDDRYQELLNIADTFGNNVMKAVLIKLKNRDHDT